MATLQVPSLGYGIRYEFGIFHQDIVDGWQVEKTDKWLSVGNPWELARPEWTVAVKLGGHTEHYIDSQGTPRARWVPNRIVNGVPYDTPILGYRTDTANTLRLWRAEAPESFDFAVFNRGDYYGAVNRKVVSENLTKVLYPNDEQVQGKELRLEQQYFFVSCSLQDMLRIMQQQQIPLERFHDKFTVQLNDTHPSIGVAELMRLLVDEQGMEWNLAWSITTKTFAYTNHTLLPEALECWPLAVFGRILPRHLEIIFEINARFLDEVRVRFFRDEDRVARMSLIDEAGDRHVRMAHLAIVGSHSVNGVAQLHSELLRSDLLRDFYELWPDKFSNKTNGVTPRRWVVLSNPRLTDLMCRSIGDGWIKDASQLQRLTPLAEDAGFREEWRKVKLANKVEFGQFALARTGITVNPHSLHDVQVKRIHEYKRQHLNILHVIAAYQRLRSNPSADFTPRTFIFGGKAAPGYHAAKLIIKLINAVGDVISRDPAVRDRLSVVFIPNFNVTTGHRVYPAADLSEQISTAGKEASGTGNMKFTMNGAMTIGTLDGANIEIRNEVGPENFFLFGLSDAEVKAWRAAGYRPMDCVEADRELADVIDLIASGFFSRGDPEVFRPFLYGLLNYDPYFVLADFRSYVDCQDSVGRAFQDTEHWARMSILNVARSGFFSSDRTILEYCKDIWRVKPVQIRLMSPGESKPVGTSASR
jgi:starch phosphorylase